jgi:hypothetical protein
VNELQLQLDRPFHCEEASKVSTQVNKLYVQKLIDTKPQFCMCEVEKKALLILLIHQLERTHVK